LEGVLLLVWSYGAGMGCVRGRHGGGGVGTLASDDARIGRYAERFDFGGQDRAPAVARRGAVGAFLGAGDLLEV